MSEFERFEMLCEEESQIAERGNGEAIGTYGEKRLHRILKRWISDDVRAQEVRVGSYVADVLTDEGIFEIQTGSFRPLLPKLRYYLNETDHAVALICPLIVEKRIVRMERESGEVLYTKRSPKHGRVIDVLPEFFWISELLPCERIALEVVLISVEEHRFSERMRYRREGAYDAELYPRALLDCVSLRDLEDYRAFLPPEMESFTAAEYGAYSKLKARKLYSALNFLCAIGLLRREKEGKKYRYFLNKVE